MDGCNFHLLCLVNLKINLKLMALSSVVSHDPETSILIEKIITSKRDIKEIQLMTLTKIISFFEN